MSNPGDQKDVYELILSEMDMGSYQPGTKLVESDLAERFGVSRTPVREALQRLETENFLTRDGRSLFVSKLDHSALGELYAVRSELEGLAASLAARHAAPEEIRVLYDMIEKDHEYLDDPQRLSRANRRFHGQIHLASHNRFLVRQLRQVHRFMVLLANTSLAADGRGEMALKEHLAIVNAIETGDGEAARAALKQHLSYAFEMRLKLDAEASGDDI